MTGEEPEVKINRPPAEKMAGGVRISRKEKHHSESEKAAKSDEEFTEESTAVAQTVLVKEREKAYPEAAVRAFHEKPKPTHEIPLNNHVKPQKHGEIFQPRRN